jgi:vitamin B12 transporter
VRKSILIIGLLFGLAPSIMRAQSFHQSIAPQSLTEVEVKGQLQELKMTDVILGSTIAKWPVKSLNEAISFALGIDMKQRGPWGSQADIGIDGGTFEQTLILINGVKVTDPQTAHHNLNLAIPLNAIERIEILRGPAAKLYGINALCGVVNIVTKQSVDKLHIEAGLQGGSSFKDNEEKSGLYYNNGMWVTAASQHKWVDQQLALSYDQGSGMRYNTAFQSSKLFYTAQARINANNQVSTLLSFVQNEFGANGYYAAPGDKESEESVQTFMANVTAQHTVKPKWSMTERLTYRRNADDYRYYRHDWSKARSEHTTDVLALEWNHTLQSSIGQWGIGIEARNEAINSTNIGIHQRQNVGMLADYKNGVGEYFTYAIGAYLNWNSNFGLNVFPAVDMQYKKDNHKWVLNAGTAQRIPSFTDLYLKQPINVGNPQLTSEYGYQAHLGYQYQANQSKLKTALFYRNIDQFIDWHRTDTTMPWQPSNISTFQVVGWSIDYVRWFEWMNNWKLQTRIGYNYLSPHMSSKTDDMSKYAIEALRHQLLAQIGIEKDNWFAHVNMRYLSRISYKDYILIDVRIGKQWKGWTCFVDGTNLLNVVYVEVGAVPLPGRWMNIGLQYKFLKN